MPVLYRKLSFVSTCAVAGLLAACQVLRPAATATPTLEPTAAPTALPSATTPPSVTVAFATPTETQPPSPTQAASATEAAPATETPDGTLAPGSEASATPAGTAGETATAPAGTDRAEFVADVTVPDGTQFNPGATFVKTWQVRNAGTITWTTDYDLVFIRGEQMDAPAAMPLPGDVPPGQAVDLSLSMTAPQALGSYLSFWMLRSAGGALFGIGPEANQPVYLQINVVAAGSTGNEPTASPGTLQVSAATMEVDEANFSGACPHAFVFTATFTSQGAGTAAYRLEASADTPSFAFDLPDPSTGIFSGAGPRTFAVQYTLEFSDSVSGQVWLHVTSPNDVTSNKVSFSLACQAAGGE